MDLKNETLGTDIRDLSCIWFVLGSVIAGHFCISVLLFSNTMMYVLHCLHSIVSFFLYLRYVLFFVASFYSSSSFDLPNNVPLNACNSREIHFDEYHTAHIVRAIRRSVGIELELLANVPLPGNFTLVGVAFFPARVTGLPSETPTRVKVTAGG